MAVIVREKVKGSGEWWIFINHKGKRRSKKIGDKRTANNVAKEIRERLAKGEMGMVKEKPPTLSAYGREMLDSSLNGWSDATVDLYKATYRLHIKPPLGHRRLDDIKKRHVKTLITNLKAKGLAASTVETALKVLRIILNHAVEDEYIAANPCDKMNKYCGGKTKKVNQLDAEETQQFVEGASHLPLVFNALFVVKVRTGLRIGEIMAIEWSDVDLNERTININKQWDYKRKEIRPPKNGSSRIVRLTPMTVEILKQLHKEGNGTELVFPNEHGNYLTYKAVRLALLRIAPKPISLHGLRHTYATLRLAKGDNIVDVSKQLGHKNITVTLDTYTHWIPMEEYQQQVDELDTLHLSAPLLHPGESSDIILQ
jgi:integrase